MQPYPSREPINVLVFRSALSSSPINVAEVHDSYEKWYTTFFKK